MFLIARCARALASWNGAECETKACHFTETFSQEAESYEYDASIEDGRLAFHRQVDPQGVVFS